MNKGVVWFRILLVTAALGLLAALAVSRALHAYWHEQIELQDDMQLFRVASGATLTQVLVDLRARSVIDDLRLAKLALRLYQPGLTVKAGEYSFPQSISRYALFEKLATGVSVQYNVTLVEGITAREAHATLRHALAAHAAPGAQQDDPATGVDNPDTLLLALLEPRARELMGEHLNPEGWFFPDTYRYVRDETALDILRRAHLRLLDVLDEEWQQRQPGLPYENRYQALVMASIVEKETGAVEEREQIAGVFVRRLRKGMRLQTDPTVIYGVRDSYSGNLTRAHLRRDTPYNTYTRGGLPPTPIALAGRGAIHAALNPADGDALYFVARGDGSHQFSKTLQEHQRAVRKYQILQRRSDYRSAPVRKPVPGSGSG